EDRPAEDLQPVGRRGRGDPSGDSGDGANGGGSMIWRRDDAEAENADHPRVPAPPERKDKDMAEGGEVTIVGTGARLEGNVVSAGNLRIDGQVKGQINADGDVVLSPQSQVEADIRSQNVSVAGRFKGNILVKGKAHLARGGRIDGTRKSKPPLVAEGRVLAGPAL